MEIILITHGDHRCCRKRANGPLVFSTDFPNESFDAKPCRRQIDELLARDVVNQANKEAILETNAKRFYGIA